MKYIIAAGGTGGHIYPALYFAKDLKNQGHEVLFVSSSRDIDFQILDNCGIDVVHYKFSGFLRDKSLVAVYKNFKNAFMVAKNFIQVRLLLAKFKPDAVIGFGGYVSLPICLVSSKMKIHTSIHEQNSYPGAVNQKLSKYADITFYTYEKSLDYFKAGNFIYSNNPRIDYVDSIINANKIEVKTDSVLFVGGSLGADKINELAVDFAKDNPKMHVSLVSGVRNFEDLNSLEIDNLDIIEYLEDPIIDFLSHELIVSRGGATTLVELDVLSKPTIVIPSPNVVEDHQTLNANEMASRGNFRVISEQKVTSKDITLLRSMLDLTATPKKLQSSVEILVKEINEAISQKN